MAETLGENPHYLQRIRSLILLFIPTQQSSFYSGENSPQCAKTLYPPLSHLILTKQGHAFSVGILKVDCHYLRTNQSMTELCHYLRTRVLLLKIKYDIY